MQDRAKKCGPCTGSSRGLPLLEPKISKKKIESKNKKKQELKNDTRIPILKEREKRGEHVLMDFLLELVRDKPF